MNIRPRRTIYAADIYYVQIRSIYPADPLLCYVYGNSMWLHCCFVQCVALHSLLATQSIFSIAQC